MPKSIPMLSAQTAPKPLDLLYLVLAAGGAERDRKLELIDLLKAILSSAFHNTDDGLGEVAWEGGQPYTMVPAFRYTYPTGTLVQGFLNLADVFAEASVSVDSWALDGGDSSYECDDTRGGAVIRVDGVPTAVRTFNVTGELGTEKSIFFYVGAGPLAYPCIIQHEGTTVATIYGGELVRLHFAGGGMPFVEVVGAPEVTLQSAKVWGFADERQLDLIDDTINSVFRITEGGVRALGVAGVQVRRRSTTLLEAIAGANPATVAHYLPHTDGYLYERVPYINDSGAIAGYHWLRVGHREVRYHDKDTARAGAGSLTTTWKDLAVLEIAYAEFGYSEETLGPPAMPTEFDMMLTVGPTAGGTHGFDGSRDNILFRFKWTNGAIWEGQILSSTRWGTGGSSATWVVRFRGWRSDTNGLVVPTLPLLGDDLWNGNAFPGGYVQASVVSGSMTHAAVSGGVASVKLRERLPKDYGPVESA